MAGRELRSAAVADRYRSGNAPLSQITAHSTPDVIGDDLWLARPAASVRAASSVPRLRVRRDRRGSDAPGRRVEGQEVDARWTAGGLEMDHYSHAALPAPSS